MELNRSELVRRFRTTTGQAIVVPETTPATRSVRTSTSLDPADLTREYEKSSGLTGPAPDTTPNGETGPACNGQVLHP